MIPDFWRWGFTKKSDRYTIDKTLVEGRLLVLEDKLSKLEDMIRRFSSALECEVKKI